MLALPNMAIIIDQMEEVDVDGLEEVYRFIETQLTRAHHDLLESINQDMINRSNDLYSSENAGNRALKNLVQSRLLALSALDDSDSRYINRCVMQFYSATNMTDRIGALTAMLYTQHQREKDRKITQQMLDDFLVKNSDPFSIMRWIRIQACYQGVGAINKIAEVMNHPAFNINSPNHVGSLLVTFMNTNVKHFHDRSGRGYAFIVDVILEQSLMNAELASVLAKSLTLVLHLDS